MRSSEREQFPDRRNALRIAFCHCRAVHTLPGSASASAPAEFGATARVNNGDHHSVTNEQLVRRARGLDGGRVGETLEW